MVLVAEYSFANINSWKTLRKDGSTRELSEAFTLPQSINIKSIKLPLKRVGIPVGFIWAEIRESSDLGPSTTIICSSNLVDAALIAEDQITTTFEFPSTPLPAGDYFIVLMGNFPMDRNNLILWGSDSEGSIGEAWRLGEFVIVDTSQNVGINCDMQEFVLGPVDEHVGLGGSFIVVCKSFPRALGSFGMHSQMDPHAYIRPSMDSIIGVNSEIKPSALVTIEDKFGISAFAEVAMLARSILRSRVGIGGVFDALSIWPNERHVVISSRFGVQSKIDSSTLEEETGSVGIGAEFSISAFMPNNIEGALGINAYADGSLYIPLGWTQITPLNYRRDMLGAVGTIESALAFGGYTCNDTEPYIENSTETVEKYNGHTWSMTTEMLIQRRQHGGCGTISSALAVAGETGLDTEDSSSCEIWNGSTWATSPNISAVRHSVVAVGTTTNSLCFGGQADGLESLATTERFNGVSWSIVSPLNVARRWHSGCGDVNNALAMNGYDWTLSTEIWSGLAWATTTNSLLWRYSGSGTGTVIGALRWGGYVWGGPPTSIETEIWDGSIWAITLPIGTISSAAGCGTSEHALSIGGWFGLPSSNLWIWKGVE